MNTGRPSPHLLAGARVITLASSSEPTGVTSNIGHPKEPVVVGLCVSGAEPVVTISEGSGHLGSGGAFWLEATVTETGGLQARWESVFARADALWIVPILGRLAAGEKLTEVEIIDAYRIRHGGDPDVRVIWHT